MPNENIVNVIAGIIRKVDGGNAMEARKLGHLIAFTLVDQHGFNRHGSRNLDVDEFGDLVSRENSDKRMGAGDLAQILVDELDLDD